MPSTSVFGAQWGDEGKGKIIDLLSRDADLVVRYQGGANAGHTVIVEGEKYILSLIPSGILHEGTVNVIGNGVALDPKRFLEEIDGLRARGIAVTPETLRVSAGAHIIFEHHKHMDRFAERFRGDGRIGTTGRGIGPCYADKAARTGLRVCEWIDPDLRRARLRAALAEKNSWIQTVHGEEQLDLEAQVDEARQLADRLMPFVTDTGRELREAAKSGKRILFEGAQGVMLDIDAGTYPFVTSSNTGTAGLASGASFPPNKVESSWGIAKAYCTRVGEGPFPTELHGERGDALRVAGGEFGAVTGRPRRCGWIDLVALRYALEINGADAWIMTKLDVLNGFDKLQVGVAYTRGSERWTTYPSHLPSLEDVTVEYETLPGWNEDLTRVQSFKELPETTRSYVQHVEQLVGVPVRLLSIGPERDQVLSRT